jgi:hypothetical protein
VFEIRSNDGIHDVIRLINTDTMGTLYDTDIEESNGVALLKGEDKEFFEALFEAEELGVVITNTHTIIRGNGDKHLRWILFPREDVMV